MSKNVTTYYLEMHDPSQLRAKTTPVEGFQIIRCEVPLGVYNRFFYVTVGKKWEWFDKLSWSLEEWQAYAEKESVQTWVGYLHGTPVGYFELKKEANGDVELAYFGLLEQFIGQGLGGLLLSKAIECAWAMGTSRVWVHTCTLDHPSALNNYQARGFKLYKSEESEA